MKSVNVSETEAAWLGFTMTMSGCLGSVVVGAILDRFLGYLKLVTEVLMIVALVRTCVVLWLNPISLSQSYLNLLQIGFGLFSLHASE